MGNTEKLSFQIEEIKQRAVESIESELEAIEAPQRSLTEDCARCIGECKTF